jgi:hypothetical protein
LIYRVEIYEKNFDLGSLRTLLTPNFATAGGQKDIGATKKAPGAAKSRQRATKKWKAKEKDLKI